jgi:alcohol dehydrogenase class IV
MNPFDHLLTTRVVFGANKIDELAIYAKTLGGRRILLVTDSGIVKTGYVERAVAALKKESLDVVVFQEVNENPSSNDVQKGTSFACEHGPFGLIIALGGGSSMDTAKGINFLLTNGGRMEDYWGFNKASKPMLPSIGIPTTAGTGSEAQSYALISQEGTHRKMACGDVKARFQLVILDPVLTLTAPPKVTAISGIDAIAHAVETYVTKTRNGFSQMHSREAWRLLNGNFEIVLQHPENLNARAAMLLGSYFAGVAIEHSMLGAAHACANPLTARFGLTHGTAVGLMLPAVIQFNDPIVHNEYKELHDNLIERIQYLKQIASLPKSLRECKVEQNVLQELAQDASTQWTGKHNPRPLTEADFLRLYERAF